LNEVKSGSIENGEKASNDADRGTEGHLIVGATKKHLMTSRTTRQIERS